MSKIKNLPSYQENTIIISEICEKQFSEKKKKTKQEKIVDKRILSPNLIAFQKIKVFFTNISNFHVLKQDLYSKHTGFLLLFDLRELFC